MHKSKGLGQRNYDLLILVCMKTKLVVVIEPTVLQPISTNKKEAATYSFNREGRLSQENPKIPMISHLPSSKASQGWECKIWPRKTIEDRFFTTHSWYENNATLTWLQLFTKLFTSFRLEHMTRESAVLEMVILFPQLSKWTSTACPPCPWTFPQTLCHHHEVHEYRNLPTFHQMCSWSIKKKRKFRQ